MITKNCEFFVSHKRKSDGVLVERCSLTGKGCFWPTLFSDSPELTCSRREFALIYEAKRTAQIEPQTT